MVKVSNNLIGFLNILTFLLSIPIIAGGIWLSKQSSTECERFLERPVIALGVFLMLVSLAGIIGACCGVSWLLWFYLLVMFLLILLLFCFTIFAFVVTNKGAGEAVTGKGYKEYRLGDYSNWLQKRVTNTKNWNKIQSCIQDSKVCKSLIDNGPNTPVDDFYKEHLSALQSLARLLDDRPVYIKLFAYLGMVSGCCKPSIDCNFTYVSPTNWTKTDTSTLLNPDCNTWNNDPSILCYSCLSCKAGLLDNVRTDWKKVAILNIIMLVALIIVYSIGCCAFRNNREDNSWKRYP